MTDDARSDAELLAASARGDDEAFGVLVRRHIRPATLLATHVTGSRDVAEDVVQDAFIVVHRHAAKFDAQRPFEPWCFGIVRRLAANRRIREQRRSRLLRMWSWLTTRHAASPHAEPALVAQLDAAVAKRAMETLSPMQRVCFDLVAVQGFSNEEVAALYEISESTVRQHVFRARSALRDSMTGSEAET